MIHKCFALIVPARLSGAVTVANLDARHGSLEVLLSGRLECIAQGDWHVYLNADQLPAELGPNIRAAQLLHDTGLDLPDVAGTAVFLGRAEHDYDADVPEHLIHRAEALFDTRLGAIQPAA
ncbi:hypothetical protein [Arthrobacter sp. U41]|uniref:hypothetical protein n=1 Tax=Arthrobacter sp. U41 TaxID=1849032 RepID=UPI0008594F6A|nr:hypothetical protein [Arthrobacter sp. U41]AOT03424.1 hypothetical protein ASPU41_08810 [Arthrobacter sp. U41]